MHVVQTLALFVCGIFIFVRLSEVISRSRIRYALSPSVAGQPVCSVTFTYSNYLAVGTLKFPRAMRVNPTASFLAGSPASFTVTGGGGGGIALDNLQIAAIGKESCFLGAAISTSFGIGYGTLLTFGSSPNLFFSAEV